jgi:methylenetetrahydrofolate dehydrogenase (NADP+) / methenyltetrahydrofolate cyclohydrolase
MPAQIIDGSALADKIKQEVATKVQQFAAHGKAIHLTAILVGSTPAGELYAQRQGQACKAVGINYQLLTLPAEITQRELKLEIRRLNADPSVTGIMMHLPLPSHLDRARLQYEIDVVKDVEGVNPANIGYVVYGHTLIAPCTALSVIELIKSTGVNLQGAEAVVVGASEIAGKPIALLLAEQMATVTLCHVATRDIQSHTRGADIVVGINRVTLPDGTKKTVGDVDFDAVRPKAGYITPVPGGVGPMTVAMLLRNTLRSAEILHNST